MRSLTQKWTPMALPIWLAFTLFLIQCEPGKSLDAIPKADLSRTPKIEIVSSTPFLLPTDTGSVQVAISDSANGGNLKGARLSISSTRFGLLSAAGGGDLDLDSVPEDGKVSFRVFSPITGTGTITVKVTSGSIQRSLPIIITVTEKPVAPKILEFKPAKFIAKETTLVSVQILDSAQERPLSNAVVSLSSTAFAIFSPTSKDSLTSDTTGSDGKISFRVLSLLPGVTGPVQVRVKTAAGISKQTTYTWSVAEETSTDRPRKMVFTASRSTLRADGTDSTDLRVLVKDDNNNPLVGEKISFTSTGGVVKSQATTDEWGLAIGTLRSERVNRSVVVTATLDKTGATAQQTVAFDGINISIAPAKRVLMVDSLNPIIFELKDGGGVPMSGDSLEIVAVGSYKGFGQTGKDSMIIVTDTRGQYKTNITSKTANDIYITARALGTKSLDTIVYNSNILTLSASSLNLSGDGIDQGTITATLKSGTGLAIDNAELRWTTTFGTFTTKPFSKTASGQGNIVLKSPRGSGLATVNVEAYERVGAKLKLLAGGNITIPIKALVVSRLELKVTPDNIPVKIGETRLIAQAFDSSNNVMSGVLVSFRLVNGAGGGDEIISPPIDYTKAGQAEASLKAGGVISQYRSVKLAAVALDINGGDTIVIASSDTVGLTISGPPHRVSVGVNIHKGENENDGTFALPCAAVVTDVNGNLVADGTPVNFSTTPIAAWYPIVTWKGTFDAPYYTLTDTLWRILEWSDYNNNRRLDPDEAPAFGYPKRAYRGEDRDGNGYINFGPESYIDINGNGIWDSAGAEPNVPNVPIDSATGRLPFVDFNKNGMQDSREKFSDDNGDGKCQCTGQKDVNGDLYEETYFGSTATHPFPGEVAVGVTRQVVTTSGKSKTKIVYVQSMARRVSIRLTAESNGIRSSYDVDLPIVKDE